MTPTIAKTELFECSISGAMYALYTFADGKQEQWIKELDTKARRFHGSRPKSVDPYETDKTFDLEQV